MCKTWDIIHSMYKYITPLFFVGVQVGNQRSNISSTYSGFQYNKVIGWIQCNTTILPFRMQYTLVNYFAQNSIVWWNSLPIFYVLQLKLEMSRELVQVRLDLIGIDLVQNSIQVRHDFFFQLEFGSLKFTNSSVWLVRFNSLTQITWFKSQIFCQNLIFNLFNYFVKKKKKILILS
jgi:hypothetical protein